MDKSRPRSSIYSDAFELEELKELIDRVTADVKEQERHRMEALRQELTLQLQRAQQDHKEARDQFQEVYSILLKCSDISFIVRDIGKSVEREKKIRQASCGSF